MDQATLGKTPRSNPVVYIGAFDDLREIFAQTDLARQRGLNASAFSFNSAQGQCQRCRGAGFEKIEMQFLSDVYIRCLDCNGRRYRGHILEVKLLPSMKGATASRSRKNVFDFGAWSIADLLEATVDDAIQVLFNFCHLRQGQRALRSLRASRSIPYLAEKASGLSWSAIWLNSNVPTNRRPSPPSFYSTNQPRACTSMISRSCSKFSIALSMAAIHSLSSNIIWTSSSLPIGSSISGPRAEKRAETSSLKARRRKSQRVPPAILARRCGNVSNLDLFELAGLRKPGIGSHSQRRTGIIGALIVRLMSATSDWNRL